MSSSAAASTATTQASGIARASGRAPGKIILCGEHAVVHGSTAVAAAIDLRTVVSIHLPPHHKSSTVEIHLEDAGVVLSWESDLLGSTLGAAHGGADPFRPSPPSAPVHDAIARIVEALLLPEDKIQIASGVSAFLYLFAAVLGVRPVKVSIASGLPLGAGLGSSAAYCVSVSGALLLCAGALRAGVVSCQGENWVLPQKDELELVNNWAFQGERIIHGKPSGIDNTVSTFGGMIKFKNGVPANLRSTMPLKMLITDTKVGRDTKALVAGVSERASSNPEAMASVFHATDSISQELAAIVEAPAADDVAVTSKEEKLEELMEMNQGLLECMGVSHASIETVLRTTRQYKLTSKLTGAGGGGCVLTLIPTLLSRTILDKVVADLESHGFRCFEVEVGGTGLEICCRSSL